MIESRVCWNAISNINFSGSTDWAPAECDTAEDERDALTEPQGAGPTNMPLGLEMVLGASGLSWWVETRETAGVEA